MVPVGVKGSRWSRFLARFMASMKRKRKNKKENKLNKSVKGSRASGFSRVERDPGLIMRFKVFRRSLIVVGFNSFLVQGLRGSKGQRVSGHVGKHL